jgi:hypothetical protein
VVPSPARAAPTVDAVHAKAADLSSTSVLSAAIPIIDPRDNRPIDLARAPQTKGAIDDFLLDDDEELDSNEDLLSGDSDYSDDDEDEEQQDGVDVTGMEFPVILTRDITARYPVGAEAFAYPAEGAPLRYSTSFLLQFSEKCRGVAQDIKAVAFPKDVPSRIVHAPTGGARRPSAGGPTSRGPRGSNGRDVRDGRDRRSDRDRRPEMGGSRPQVELTNRAADAWKRSAQAYDDADVVLLRVVGFFLGVLLLGRSILGFPVGLGGLRLLRSLLLRLV